MAFGWTPVVVILIADLDPKAVSVKVLAVAFLVVFLKFGHIRSSIYAASFYAYVNTRMFQRCGLYIIDVVFFS
jgi:hypothetical protein